MRMLMAARRQRRDGQTCAAWPNGGERIIFVSVKNYLRPVLDLIEKEIFTLRTVPQPPGWPCPCPEPKDNMADFLTKWTPRAKYERSVRYASGEAAHGAK